MAALLIWPLTTIGLVTLILIAFETSKHQALKKAMAEIIAVVDKNRDDFRAELAVIRTKMSKDFEGTKSSLDRISTEIKEIQDSLNRTVEIVKRIETRTTNLENSNKMRDSDKGYL